jgi:hypothetical protein
MRSRGTTWILVTVAALGCASTEYTNVRDPSAGRTELLNDSAECQRTSWRPSGGRGDEYKYPVMIIDQDLVNQCLAERGWRPVSK